MVRDHDSRTVLDLAVIGMICTAIIILMLSTKWSGEPSLGNRIFRLLGDASFTIYLFHEFFVSASLGIWSSMYKNTNPVAVLVGVTLIAIAGSSLVFYFVERPIISWLNQSRLARLKTA
ncbi:hypothetical protein [Methylotenera sp.]|uniref:acyltransferase family protein n=1 Tax=Methylotenera sp. TaxID=2051956 RepID=UPI0024889981|nr:hypothetical protein [Methylotenera sp.]MDI1299032.1 hypothetical protein [Methylotenera sp.]